MELCYRILPHKFMLETFHKLLLQVFTNTSFTDSRQLFQQFFFLQRDVKGRNMEELYFKFILFLTNDRKPNFQEILRRLDKSQLFNAATVMIFSNP